VLTYTLIEAPDHGWGSGRSVAGYLIAAALFAIFVLRERGADELMLDVSLFKNLRFTAASGSVTVVFFGLSGFSFLMTQYFQFLKGYGPLSTGVHLLPVALAVGVMSVVGTKLAVNFGTKQIVTAGLFILTIFFFGVATISTATTYLEIAGQMILGGAGVGMVSAPATEAIMGVVPKAKAGVGSAVNDATRLLGSTLGIAVIGSVYASIYRNHVGHRLPATLSGQSAHAARDSVGGALTLATNSVRHGNAVLGSTVNAAASSSFFDGFNVACILVAILSGVGGLVTLLLPAHPVPSADSEAADVLVLALEAE
jgi:hypothetical protein